MGATYSSRMWYAALPALSAHHRVLTFDNRGTGESGFTKAASISDMAADARTVLDAAGVDRAHVYGVSLGGVIAQQLAIETPERVRSLVLGCTGILTADKPRAPKVLQVIFRLPRSMMVKLVKYGPACPPERAAHDRAMLLADKTRRVALVAQQDALRAYACTVDQVRRLTMPALVLHGTADTVVSLEWGRELAERCRTARSSRTTVPATTTSSRPGIRPTPTSLRSSSGLTTERAGGANRVRGRRYGGRGSAGGVRQVVAGLVPGGVHESLLAAGLLPHPYVGDNEAAARWIEGRTWWFRCAFDAPTDVQPQERLRLVCHGLDGVATLWLNGTELGRHMNQHRPAVFDVTSLVRPQNQMLLRFAPPLDDTVDEEELELAVEQLRQTHRRIRPGTELDEERLALRVRRTRRRKAACGWGWDFAPRLPSMGLHRPVELVRVSDAVVAGTHARTMRLDEERREATVAVDVEVDTSSGQPDEVRVTLTDPVGRAVSVDAPTGGRVTVELVVSDVALWWTHDLGDQPLYELRTELLRAGAVVGSRVERIGIRTVELDTGEDEVEGGRRFRLVLNGVPLFARGANWVPASQLVGSVTDDTYRELVELAKHGQMNMLRVWGGGIYEADAFYDACDQHGVLVWQDFMFACDHYPSESETLAEELRLEAEYQVRRLRNHAALALWAGNNEVQMIRELVGHDLKPGNWGWSFFHDLLPDAVRRHSPEAPYWPGSPWGEADDLVNGVSDGDRHAWEVWHGVDVGAGGPVDYASRGDAVHFRRYAHDKGRFISEFGIHAAPELQTLERWLPAEALTLRHSVLDHHNKDTPADKGWALMEVETGTPTTLQQYVDFSMACQAEGLKYGSPGMSVGHC